jgi:signal peptidase I
MVPAGPVLDWALNSKIYSMLKIARWSFFLFAVTVWIVMKLFVQHYRMTSVGMYPGLSPGSLVFAEREPYPEVSSVKHGDVVVFLHEENGQEYSYVWRVVALPGETVEASGEILTINGHPVARQRVRKEGSRTIFREQIGDADYEVAFAEVPKWIAPEVSITVPPEHVFVMGDNRFEARDSRYMGPIEFSAITGKKLFQSVLLGRLTAE